VKHLALTETIEHRSGRLKFVGAPVRYANLASAICAALVGEHSRRISDLGYDSDQIEALEAQASANRSVGAVVSFN